jgi:hypothetical protein
MALKADRKIDVVDISYFLNEVASKGVIVSVSTAGSGVALEDPANLVTVSASSSGARPLGMLLTEFVNVDQTRTPINWHKDQAQKGSKAAIMTKGWAVTDQVTGSPAKNDWAVLSSSGAVTGVAPHQVSWNQIANPRVGTFRSIKNEDGYARVYVDL